MADIVTYNRSALPWTVNQLVGSIRKGNSVFDNAVQRSFVWTKEQQSLLIHSLIINAPVPPLYANRNSTSKIYDFIDGKQRSTTIYNFLSDEFELVDVPAIPLEDGSEIDINGKKFSELDEQIQSAIRDYSLTINYYDDLDEDQVADIFNRLNNSKPMTAIERMRVKCPSIKRVQDLCKHAIFNEAVTENARKKYTDEDIVIKSFAMIRMEKPCLDTKAIKPFAAELEISDVEYKWMEDIYSRILDIRDKVKVINKKAAKRMLSRTHLVTIIGFMKEYQDDSDEQLRDFFARFYGPDKDATISTSYNFYSKSGSGHVESVKARLDAMSIKHDEQYVIPEANKEEAAA